jgi:hypothetical protein
LATGASTRSTSAAGAHLLGGNLLVVATLGQSIGDAGGGVDAEVRLYQQVLKLQQGIRVELALGEDAGDVLRQLGGGLGEALPEALEPAALSGCRRRRRLMNRLGLIWGRVRRRLLGQELARRAARWPGEAVSGGMRLGNLGLGNGGLDPALRCRLSRLERGWQGLGAWRRLGRRQRLLLA